MVIGFVEVIRPFQVRGWAFEPESPELRVPVELRLGADELGSAVADVPRNDLRIAGHGDGAHGFIINFDRRLPVEFSDALEVVALGGSRQAIRLPIISNAVVKDVDAPPVVAEPQSTIRGFFDLLADGTIIGWAFDASAPAEPLRVEVHSGGAKVVESVADNFRPDLVIPCAGYAEHGFVFELQPEFGLPPSLEVRAINADGKSAALQRLVASPSAPSPSDEDALAGPLRHFPGASSDRAQRPVFVLGAARSGTSAVAQGLVAATRYAGHGEGHLLDLIQDLLATTSNFYKSQAEEWKVRDNTLIAHVPEAYVKSGIKHIFVEMARTLFPTGDWVDKTPRLAMIVCAPLLHEIWPEARFVFMRRRGIENVASRARKFPGVPFEEHCREWASVMLTWARTRGQLGASALELDQMDLAREPRWAAGRLGKHLTLQMDEIERLTIAFERDRPERTSQSFTVSVGLTEMGWTVEQQEIFLRTCGAMMAEYRYSAGAEYLVK